MGFRVVKLKIGQCWKNKSFGRPDRNVIYKITKFTASQALCSPTPDNGIKVFAVNVGPNREIPIEDTWEELPSECPCGIFRGDCDYHR